MSRPIQITNPRFNDGHYPYNGVPELQVPRGWSPFWLQGTPEQVADGYFKRPEFRPEPLRAISGLGQKWFTTFATHDAGIYQVVNLSGSVHLRLSAQCQYWSEHTDGTGGGLACQAGIDPTGGIDPFGPDVIWGEWHGQDDPDGWKGDTWREVSVEAQAKGSQVTIFLRSACRYRAKHNDSYWEDVVLLDTTATPPPDPDPDPGETLAQVLRQAAADAENLAEVLRDAAERLDQVQDLLFVEL